MYNNSNGSQAPVQKPEGGHQPRPKTFDFSVDGTRCHTEHQFLTGTQIKSMAGVPADFELYLVVPGYQDELIDDDKIVNLARPGIERFESRKPGNQVIIFINTSPKPYDRPVITYNDVVILFGGDPNNPQKGYSISYAGGPRENPRGVLAPGHQVFVKHKMRFNVDETDRS